MGRIAEKFKSLKAKGETALIPFVTCGDPDLATSEAIVLTMAEAGADIIELGVPFSDPIAEGPTIQRSSERALAQGVSLRGILAMVARLRPKIDIPLVLMGYANPVYAMGEQAFARAAAEAGVDGIIIPDLPPEEGQELYDACNGKGIDCILLAAPTTSEARLPLLAGKSRGFLYYVSLTGVTGARSELAGGIEEGVRAAQKAGDIPVCVGFGISTPDQAEQVSAYADGVVVGSAVVDRIEAATSRDDAVDRVGRFISELKDRLR